MPLQQLKDRMIPVGTYPEVMVCEFASRRAGAHRNNVAKEVYRNEKGFKLVSVL